MKDFPKKYNYHIVEKEIQDKNKKLKDYKSKNLSYVFSDLIPISDKLHLGNAFSLIYQDILTKYLNILGNNFCQNIGLYTSPSFKKIGSSECEKITYKTIFSKQKINKKQIYQFGIHNTKNILSTMDEDYLHISREIFIDLYKKGLIYEDKKIVYRSNEQQSVIGSDDVILKTIHGKKYNIRYFIETKNDSVVICTTNPETIFSDVALLVNPNDKRYKKFVGSNVLIPIINKAIPILTDETVDTMSNNGILRVNPHHDFVGLELAKKHGLCIDTGSIDDKGCFTDLAGIFSGKKISEFFDNIIQYLDDISNLDSISEVDYDIAIFKKTGEKLQPLLKKQRFIKISEEQKEIVKNNIYTEDISVNPNEYLDQITNSFQSIDNRCISRQYSFGQLLPAWENTKGRTYVFDELDIIDKLIKSRKSRKVMLTILIFNLILDGYLSTSFSIDELVDVLFSNISQSDKKKIDYYIEYIQEKLSSNPKAKKYFTEFKELRKVTEIIDMTRKNSFEKIQLLLDILKKSYLIENQGEDYKFNINELMEDRFKISIQNSVFDPSFLCSLRSLYVSGTYKDITKKNPKGLLSIGSDNIDQIPKILLINSYINNSNLFNKIIIHQLILNDKLNKITSSDNISFDIKDILKNNGKDGFRLSFLLNGEDNNFVYKIDNLHLSARFLDKLRNASRFIFNNFFSSRRKLNIINLRRDIEKNADKLHETDIWIIYTFKDLLDDVHNNINKGNIMGFANKLLGIIRKYFCDWYLEIIKENHSDYTSSVVLYHLVIILKLLYPYSPNITEKIIDMFGANIHEIDIKDLYINTDKIHKNYKVHLLFDIMDKILLIREDKGLKQHESVDIFLQANTDFIELIDEYEKLLKKLLRIGEILYIKPYQEIPDGYTVDSVINITLGVKTKKIHSEKDELNKLITELEEKEHYLQNLRNIMSAIPSSKKIELEEKNKEMKKIKKAILDIEYKINKIKMNK